MNGEGHSSVSWNPESNLPQRQRDAKRRPCGIRKSIPQGKKGSEAVKGFGVFFVLGIVILGMSGGTPDRHMKCQILLFL